jgi:carboxyl-terminal processing protease
MEREFMDEQREVKKKRSWAFRAAKWLAITLVVVVVGVLLTTTIWQKWQEHTERVTAALPVRERNLAIFDAGCELLKSHYYNPAVFKTDQWRTYEAYWRKEAAASQPGFLLYRNVLSNFGANFLDSHVFFEQPVESSSSSAPEQKPGQAPAAPRSPERQAKQDGWDKRFAILAAGPGFASAQIRRGKVWATVVTDVVPGSPADRSGISPGWAVPVTSISADDSGVRFSGTFLELSGEAAFELERVGHPPGVKALGQSDPYTLAHGVKHAFELELLPSVHPRAPSETRRLAGGITYLRFDSFSDGDVMGAAFDAIDNAGPEGLVLDLRHNIGGMRWYMERVLGRLLGNDVELGTLRDRDSSSSMVTWRWGGHYKGPIVMLIGPDTASAGEIAAATLQDLKRGKLIGRMTNGSVLKSKHLALPDGGTMSVPESDFFRAGNRRIEGVGVEPDILVMPTLADVRAGRDPALERAVQELGKLP